MGQDLSSQLPDGNFFPFWEDRTDYRNFLYVDGAGGNDGNPGTADSPLKTINAAAKAAEPGTKVIIRGGEYRETVRPARGGNDERSMICYEAAAGEQVFIKASVEVKEFRISEGWSLTRFNEKP
ncbi:MAG: DUF1565 domain-containing protein, partial [Spirochaetaceae bacterium]|nr:DUF1565 domain-containing protein [Spirochaetaceae bacterium]